jgi:antiviral helicase SLH1
VDSLNAEISLGTVANVQDAVRWMGYTYMFVRMRKNPFQYGMFGLRDREFVWRAERTIGLPRDALTHDPRLVMARTKLIEQAAQKLADCRMIAFNRQTGMLNITDLGRIAAKYYIRHTSIEIFNKEFRPRMTEADALAMLCMSTEVMQLVVIVGAGR